VSERPLVVGIDVAASRPCVGVALQPLPSGGRVEAVSWHESLPAVVSPSRRRRGRGEHAADGSAAGAGRAVAKQARVKAPPDLLEWLDGLQPPPAVVAVDSPQALNRRLLAKPGAGGHRSRVCDFELLRRRLGVYQVPSRAEVGSDPGKLPAWMAVGLDIFAALRRHGYELPADGALPGALGQPPAMLEVYPYASFVSLLGRTLTRKTTREGLRLRVAALRSEGVLWDRGGGDEYYDHDSLDALAAALTGWRFFQGAAHRLGDPREGFIWLPVSAERFDEVAPLPGDVTETG
jgi:predicted nuclease with RNAse H fold